MRPTRPPEEQILVWCGVVAQLARTRVRQLLEEMDLPYPLFVLLQHFGHDPDREWTVTGLADAFQAPLPGVSKNVRKLVDRGWLAWRGDEADGRVKRLRLTREGLRMRDAAAARVLPDRRSVFRDLRRDEIATLHRLLGRLKTTMDEHREPLVRPDAPAAAGGRGRRYSSPRSGGDASRSS